MQHDRVKLLFFLIIGMGLSLGYSTHADVKYIDMSNLGSKVTIKAASKLINASSVQMNAIEDSSKTKLDKIIEYNANKYDISPILLKAIIRQESNFNASAVSSKGARGLMQVLPSTAKGYGSYDLFLPHHNIEVGSRHLSRLLKKYDRLPLALAAYNAGEGNVRKYNGIPPFLETQNYILKVLTVYNSGLDDQIYSTGSRNNDSQPLAENNITTDKVNTIMKKTKVSYFNIEH